MCKGAHWDSTAHNHVSVSIMLFECNITARPRPLLLGPRGSHIMGGGGQPRGGRVGGLEWCHACRCVKPPRLKQENTLIRWFGEREKKRESIVVITMTNGASVTYYCGHQYGLLTWVVAGRTALVARRWASRAIFCSACRSSRASRALLLFSTNCCKYTTRQ